MNEFTELSFVTYHAKYLQFDCVVTVVALTNLINERLISSVLAESLGVGGHSAQINNRPIDNLITAPCPERR